MIPTSEMVHNTEQSAGYKLLKAKYEREFNRHVNLVRTSAKSGKPIDGSYSCGWADALEWVLNLPSQITKESIAQGDKNA